MPVRATQVRILLTLSLNMPDATSAHSWTYRARPERVIDGDTFILKVDLGFRIYTNAYIRLADVDTNEIYGVPKDSEEYQKGIEQKEFVENFMSEDGEWPIVVKTGRDSGKYGRWLGHVYDRDGRKLSDELINRWPEVENGA